MIGVMLTAPRVSASHARSVPALVLLLSLVTVATITVLQNRSSSSRDAEMGLTRVSDTLNRLQADPFRTMAVYGGTPALARRLVRSDERRIVAQLDELAREQPPTDLRELRATVRANMATIDRLLPITTRPAFPDRVDEQFFRCSSAPERRAPRLSA